MSTLPRRTVLIREKRKGTIAAYSGTAQGLARESREEGLVQRVRTFAQDGPSDLQRALSVLRTLEGLAIVVHGPSGCAASLNGGYRNTAPWTVTGIDERDSIMGGDRKLRASILAIHAAHAPRAIAVVATPVVAINNDDIDSVVTEVNEELGIPVIPVYTDGFRSKVAGSGYDAVVHALLREHLWQPEGDPGGHVNLLSIAEDPRDVRALAGLLEELGADVEVFPRHGRLETFERVVRARLSLSIDPEEGEYPGSVLEERRGIPFLSQDMPIGVAGTRAWLEGAGKALGLDEEARVLGDWHGAFLEHLEDRLAPYRGRRVFVNLPAAQALAVIPFLEELGLGVAGLAIPSLNQLGAARFQDLARRRPNLPVMVGEGQVFEEVNLLGSLAPDLYLGRGSAAVHALRLGIPVLDLQHVPILGFAGAERLVEALDRALSNPSLAAFLAEPPARRYAPGWLSKSTHWFIKHEVR